MSEPTDWGSTGSDGTGPAPKGSAPAPDVSSSTSPTTEFPAAQDSGSAPRHSAPVQHRAEGSHGGVSTAHSGGAAGEAAPVVPPSERQTRHGEGSATRGDGAATRGERPETVAGRRGPMESVLVVRRIDPWSAFTTVLGLMFALYLVWMVAVGVTYLLLSGMGVWDRLGGLLSGVAGDASASAVGPSTIFLYAGGVGLLNVLLLSILTTLAVFIYNLAAGLTGGGVQVTLGDRRR